LTPLHGSQSQQHHQLQTHNTQIFGDSSNGTQELNVNLAMNSDESEREQLEGFMMMYELLRPICRASLAEETVQERRKS